MPTEKNQLPIPLAAQADDAAVELARIWAASGRQHVSLTTGIWEDAAAWGIMLVDLARHIADAYAHAQHRSRSEVLARIREGFDAEWQRPSDEPEGRLLD